MKRPPVAHRFRQLISCRPMKPMCRSFSSTIAQTKSAVAPGFDRSKKSSSWRRLTPRLSLSVAVISGSLSQTKAFSR